MDRGKIALYAFSVLGVLYIIFAIIAARRGYVSQNVLSDGAAVLGAVGLGVIAGVGYTRLTENIKGGGD